MQVKFIQFADIKVPKLVESRGELSIMRFGEKNLFPNDLLQMFNKSAKHNAIVLGKVNYITGQGFGETESDPNPFETWDELLKKAALDIELFGGCYLEAHWQDKKVAHWYLVPYQKVRSNKDNTQFTVKDWTSLSRTEEKETIAAFNPKMPEGKQILFYKEYRPGFETYTLPGYLGCLNYIQTDIEISKYHLSTITNGMFASKMINFFQGLPTEEEQKGIDKGLKEKFTGAENAGSIMVTYNDDPAKAPTVLDLSATDLDKHFDILNKTVQQEIFAGHQITSPMLFGIKTEGQLGGRTEMREAYEIFKSTYCNDKQQNIERLFTDMVGYMGKKQEMKITAVEPIGIDFSEAIYKEFAPREWIIEKMGIDLTKYPSTAPKVNPDGTPVVEDMVNDNLKNLTGRQQQQLLRIVRLFSKGQLTKAQAAMQLKAFGLTDQQVNDYLGLDDDPLTDDAKFSSQDEDDRMFIEFSNHGEDRSKFDIIKKRKVFSFADEMVTELEAEVLDLIKKDKRITAEVIAETLGTTAAGAQKIIDNLENIGRLTSKAKRIGQDVIIERTLTEPLSKITDEKPRTSTFKIMYGYDGPQDSRNRPFCARMMELNRLYTRAEIETISRRLGYSVFDRRGGWYHNPSTDETTPYCRHTWTSFVTIKRK